MEKLDSALCQWIAIIKIKETDKETDRYSTLDPHGA